MASSQKWFTDLTLYLDDYLSVFYVVCAAIGIPVNAIVIATIVGLRRLHLHRTFTWLGIGFANILMLTYHLLEALTTHGSSPVASFLFSWLNGLCGPFLVIIWPLSLLERHLYLKYSNWYKRTITSCWTILALQAASFIILCLAVKGRYFFVTAPHVWQRNIADIKCFGSFMVAGFIIALVGQVAVWTVSNRNYPSAMALVNWIALHPFHEVEDDITSGNVENGTRSRFVVIGQERVSHLDLEAARSAAISFAFLFILALPSIVSVILLALCVDRSPSSGLTECNDWVKFVFYGRAFIVLHCFCISPAIFVFLSRDFRSALRDRGLSWV